MTGAPPPLKLAPQREFPVHCWPTYHPEQSSRPVSITVEAQDKHKGQTEVIAFPLRSPGVLAGHFLLHNNSPCSPHNDNVNILYVPYNNHSANTQQGESKDNVC